MLRKGNLFAPGLATIATLGALALLAAGCASRTANMANGAPATEDRSGMPSDPARSSEPVALTGATLMPDGDAPRLLLTGAGPLAPTVFSRDEGKTVVVDLMNAVAAPGFEPPRVDGKLFSKIEMKSFVELGKPHLQFELRSVRALEPSVGTEAGSLAMAIRFDRVAPSEAAVALASTEPAPIQVEALPAVTTSAPRGAKTEAPTPAATLASPAVSTVPASLVRHEAQRHPATRLESVLGRKSHEDVLVTLSGNGDFGYEAFALSNPPRYVVDLTGVRNASLKRLPDLKSDTVLRVRVSQFKTEPQPVTRVVFDLAAPVVPDIRSGAAGLVLAFGKESPVGETSGIVATTASAIPVQAQSDAGRPVPSEVAPTEPRPVASTAESTVESRSAPAAGSYEKHEVEETREPVVGAPASASPAEAVKSEATMAAQEPVRPVESTPAASLDRSAASASEATAAQPTTPAPEVVVTAAPAPAAPPAPPAATIATELNRSGSAAAAPEVVPAPEVRLPAPSKSAKKKRAPSSEDRALIEAAETLLAQQDAPGRPKDLQNPYESRAIGAGEKAYTGEPITLNLKDADIKDTLQKFSELTGLNIVLDPDVRGTVTVSLTDIPWDQALELILRINGLGFVLEGNVMRIASQQKLAQEEQNKLNLQKAQDLNRPVKTVIQKLSYANVDETAKTAKSVMSPRGDIVVDARSNTLIIKELPDYLPTVLDLIKNLDVPTPQVIIEARVVEATRTFSRTLGIDWHFRGVADQNHGNPTGLIFPANGTVNGDVALPNGSQILRFVVGNVLDTFHLDMALSAAEARGLVKVVSTPKVQTQTNQKASIQSGFQIPVQTTVNNTTSVLYIDATLKLDVTPQITSEGTVILDIKVQKREPAVALNPAGGQNVPLTTRDAQTKLMVRDGGTSVIGGIFKLTTNSGQSMIPGLWKIPLLGNLFRNKSETETSDELMIFITPRIVKNP